MSAAYRIDRRGFVESLAGAGMLTGYSLVVHAGEGGGTAPGHDAVEARMAAAAPDLSEKAKRGPHEPNMRLVDVKCDFLVAGGGMAGVCAALAAARHGMKVVLVQDRSRLGGNASSEIRMHIVGADVHGQHPGWREGGILEELRLENVVHNPHGAWELWDLLLYDKVVSEPNVLLLLDTAVYRAEVKDGRIREVWARSDKTEHIYRIEAAYCADCTGDCRLGLEAGAAFRTGHEGQAEFNEPLAPPEGGPETLGSSLLFTSKDYGTPIPFVPPAWARKVTKEQLEFRRPRSWEYGYWWIEWGGLRDAVAENERIRFELLSIVLGVWDYIKNSGEYPESATWALDWVGMIPGKRSTRRLEGPHILTQQDLMGLNGDFPDAVAVGGWPFDDHPPGGFDDTLKRPAQQVNIDEVYNIPLRALFSRTIENLFMAGRNVSASHVAFTSMRVMATCAVQGQAVGTAAALCVEKSLAPAALCADGAQCTALQQCLLRDDQSIKDVPNRDPEDLARSATASASETVPGSDAAHVLTGFTRDVPGAWDHRWGGAMHLGKAWLELHWTAPVHIGQVQLTFDSGFHRELTLSEQRNVRERVHEGPQPETVRDYKVSCWDEEKQAWQPVAEVTGNYLRLRRHDFTPVKTTGLRITVTATNGAEEARIYEVRCYA